LSRDARIQLAHAESLGTAELVAKTDDVVADGRSGCVVFRKGGEPVTIHLTPDRLAALLAWLDANP
jgi:hypothetical protein